MQPRERWMPLLLGVLGIAGLLAVLSTHQEEVAGVLGAVADAMPSFDHLLPGSGDPWQDPSPDGPEAASDGAPGEDFVLDLEHPSERDWRFLFQTLDEGTPEGRRSAARALVVVGDPRGVRPLFDQARPEEEDAMFFCLAALEILRMQVRPVALSELIVALNEEGRPMLDGCRLEVRDRFELAGGKSADALVELVTSPDARVRSFVAGFLASDTSGRYREAVAVLCNDPVPTVTGRLECRASSASTEP